MLSVAPIAPPPGGRTFPAALVVLALVAGAQGVYLLRHAGQPEAQPPKPLVALQSAPALEAAPAEPAPPPLAAEEEIVTAEAEKRLLAALPRPTPVPARRDTPLSRVGTLVSMARALRDRGDTSTALTRLREAQVIAPKDSQIISEMALTYEKMGLTEKATTQWRRIFEMGEQAGIYYAAAEAKLYALQMPPPGAASYATEEPAPFWPHAGLMGETGEPALRLGKVGTTDDTGNSQPLRRLKLRIPIEARAAQEVAVQDVVIQVFFYDRLSDGMLVETNADVSSQWVRRTTPEGEEAGIDWSTPAPEVLEVEYAQIPPPPAAPGQKEPPMHRNYFGYVVRVYYKGELNAVQAEPARLLEQFPPPPILQPADFPQ